MFTLFKKATDNYREYKQYCSTKKVQSVVGLGYTPQDTFQALVKFQKQLQKQNK